MPKDIIDVVAMKVRIEINDIFAQDLLQDEEFLSELSLVFNGTGISEIWVENKVIDNDENTFRAQVLEMVKKHYSRIAESNAKYLQFSYDGVIPQEVRFGGVKHRLGHLIRLIDYSNE